jgi:REP element-mobilizing transposase RayT
MELTTEQIKQIYDEYIGIMNKDGTQCRILEIEKDHVHALLEFTHPKVKIYQLTTIREQSITERPIVQLIHSWGEEEYPLARIAFKCFCHEEPDEIGKMWEGNRQIALYSDEARHKDELISELIDKSGAL